jgi:hypothetical protein
MAIAERRTAEEVRLEMALEVRGPEVVHMDYA